jgi:phosphate transport system protein
VRVTFQEELDQLEASLQEEGSLVLRVLRGALNALAQRDIELADDVISFDDDVDRLYIQIQAEIESVLARQTPVATDLRLVLALLHVNLHLERMADYSVTIAKLTKLVADVEPDPMLSQSLQEMGERAEEMIRVALDSLANRDLAAAESLVDLDELIDRSNRRFVERVVEIVAEPEALVSVREAVEAAGFTVEDADVTMIPKTTVAIDDESSAKKLVRLIEALEENDDVQDVYANFDIPERVLESAAS